jgi:hypothetical protein
MFLGMLLIGIPVPGSVYSADTWTSFDLVRRLGSSNFEERDRIERQLATTPAAMLAVVSGTSSPDAEIQRRCRAILSGWAARQADRGLKNLVREAGGDFDRFVNSLLKSPPELPSFARAAAAARAFDGFIVRNSFPNLTMKKDWPLTPFHEFNAYLKAMKPTLPGEARKGSSPFLDRASRADIEKMFYSVLLCSGNVRVGSSTGSLIIAGGDVVCDGHLLSTMVIASGDVTVKSRRTRGLIIAGGNVTIQSQHASDLVLVTPGKAHIEGRHAIPVPGQRQVSRRLVVFEQGSKPCADLFAFRSLKDYGIDASADGDRIKIKKVETQSPFSGILKQNDSVIRSVGETIESVGNLRRILSSALDTQRIDLQVDRDGQILRVAGAIKVASP